MTNLRLWIDRSLRVACLLGVVLASFLPARANFFADPGISFSHWKEINVRIGEEDYFWLSDHEIVYVTQDRSREQWYVKRDLGTGKEEYLAKLTALLRDVLRSWSLPDIVPSPDGKYLACISQSPAHKDILMIVTSEGSIIHQGPANASRAYPAWSPDSRWCFCFLQGRTQLSSALAQDGFVAISAVNVKTPSGIKTYPVALHSQGKVNTLAGYYDRPIHRGEPVTRDGPRNPFLPDFHFGSMNHIVLVYPDGDLPTDSVIFEEFHISDTSKSVTTHTRLVPDGWDFDYAFFSPKGDSIVWKFRRENSVELWISDEKGGNLKRIGKFYSGEIKPSTNVRLGMVEPYSLKWLPSGKAISFREAGEFYVVSLDRKKISRH